MKNKGRLLGFSKLEDEVELQNNVQVPKYLRMTYPGICTESCTQQPSKCLAGIYDQQNLQKNVRLLDQQY